MVKNSILVEVFYQTFAKYSKFNPPCIYPIQIVDEVSKY